jgi:hypothetical protein
MFLSLYDEVTNVLCVSLLSHDRYQCDSTILSKQTWAYPRQHLQQLLWCQGRWRDADVTKACLETNFYLSSTLLRKVCVHYANGFDNVESVHFFYSNPVFRYPQRTCRWKIPCPLKHLRLSRITETQHTVFLINVSLCTAADVSNVKPNEQHWQTQNITFLTGMHNNVWTERIQHQRTRVRITTHAFRPNLANQILPDYKI